MTIKLVRTSRKRYDIEHKNTNAFLKLLRDNNFISSNSERGNPYDNALIESFFKTLKRELLSKRYYQTKVKAKIEVNYAVVYYNKKRCHSSLRYMSPSEFVLTNS